MSEHDDRSTHVPAEPDPDEAWMDDVLARVPDADATWADLPAGLEDVVVRAIAAAVADAQLDDGATDPHADDVELSDLTDDVAPPSGRVGSARTARVSAATWGLAAAAAVVLIVAGVLVLRRNGDGAETFTIAGTEAVPEASAEVGVSVTPSGLELVLRPSGLPAAPEGSYYEAWLSDGVDRVSVGTFHVRDGNDPIWLWSGVTDASFDTFAVTLEPLDADNSSSGDVYLRGVIDLDG